MKTISIKGILEDLENGLTRTTTSQGYDEAVGSIETKYELTKAEVKEMFQHELLKNRKTKKAPSFRLVDDVTPQEEPVLNAGTPIGLTLTSEPGTNPQTTTNTGYAVRRTTGTVQSSDQEGPSPEQELHSQVTNQSQF
jgi:hypothetical protein